MPALHFALVWVPLPFHDEAEGVMGSELQGADWYQQQQLEEERYQIAVQALRRCREAGAKEDDLLTLARECGIDPKYITTGEQCAQN